MAEESIGWGSSVKKRLVVFAAFGLTIFCFIRRYVEPVISPKGSYSSPYGPETLSLSQRRQLLAYGGDKPQSQVTTPTGVDANAFYEIASFTYENQKLERARYSSLSMSLAPFGANWPCLWGEEVTGHMDTWRNNWKDYKDGWKFTCGLRRIVAPCLVYSLGSSGNMAFEKGLLADNPSCVVHIFDKDSFGLEQWFPDAEMRGRQVMFHQTFIGAFDNVTATPPVRSLPSIMRELGHSHLDVLKIDIEGSEWEVLMDELPSVGQLLVEVHEKRISDVDKRVQMLSDLFENIEHHGLRLFHKEVNARYDLNCIEFAFIQKRWTPTSKNYTDDTTAGVRPAVRKAAAATAARASVGSEGVSVPMPVASRKRAVPPAAYLPRAGGGVGAGGGGGGGGGRRQPNLRSRGS